MKIINLINPVKSSVSRGAKQFNRVKYNMLEIKENFSLVPFNSFRIGGEARYFVDVKNVEEIKEALKFAKDNSLEYYILGGGSNLLISSNALEISV